MQQLFSKAFENPHKLALVDTDKSYTYGELTDAARTVSALLLDGKQDLDEMRVAFMVAPGFDYVAVQWGIWMAGGIAVPICISYPLPSIAYVLKDTGAKILVAGSEYEELLATLDDDLDRRLVRLSEDYSVENEFILPRISSDRGAMILYTSGTTSLPKGVLTTHATIESQIQTLIEAWKWTDADYTVCLLPLHHVHGIINVLSCALWAGATVQFLYPFDPNGVFESFLTGHVTVFMAVPTIYFKLISHFESESAHRQNQIAGALNRLRLMVSGSAALPISVMEKWQKISGHYLLERYGMTEIGMAISNPYQGDRRAGFIGLPLPGVSVRLVDEECREVAHGQPGEIQVKGPAVFREYWGNPEATQKSFTEDGWFRTGDIALMENNYYKILGRDSVDIIKSGGYKISALEIEDILRLHPQIQDCAVVGLPDEEWGEIVGAAILCRSELDSKELTTWIRERIAPYKTPRKILFLSELPRNAMGKVVKNDLKKMFS